MALPWKRPKAEIDIPVCPRCKSTDVKLGYRVRPRTGFKFWTNQFVCQSCSKMFHNHTVR